MNKNMFLKVLNPIMFISFLLQAFTAIVMVFFEEAGTRSIHEIHEYNGMLLMVLVVMHLSLNWTWVKSVLFRKAQ